MKTTIILILVAVSTALLLQCVGNTTVSGTGTLIGNPTVAGVLYNSDGSFAANVTVHIRPKNYLPDISRLGLAKRIADTASTMTDDSGKFAFDTTLDTGTYVIEAKKENNAVLIDSVVIVHKDSTVHLTPDTLKPMGSIKGVIQSSDSVDQGSIYIFAYGIDRYTSVDSNGNFTFTSLAEGNYHLDLYYKINNLKVLDTMNIQVTAAETTDVKIVHPALLDTGNLDSGLIETWKITGHVQDGYTGAFLSHAEISYQDRDGVQQTITTSVASYFACTDLPFGSVTLNIQYTKDSTEKYTTAVLTIAGGEKGPSISDSNNYKYRDTSIVVRLYPMTGSVGGIVAARIHRLAPLMAGSGVPVEVTFADSLIEMKYVEPRVFRAVTDSFGIFRIDSLPLVPFAQLTVFGSKVNGIDFDRKVVGIPDFVNHGIVGIGTVVLDTPLSEKDPATKFHLLYTNFPSKQILPNQTMMWTFSAKPDSISYAVIQPVNPSAAMSRLMCSVSGNSFSATPNPALDTNAGYIVLLFVYGAAGGKYENGLNDTIWVKSDSAGKAVSESDFDFATSNVFDPVNPSVGKDGFMVSDSIVVTTNKTLLNANAILREASGNVFIPITVFVNGTTVVVKPSIVLDFAKKYNLSLIVTSNIGEVKSSSTDFTTVSRNF